MHDLSAQLDSLVASSYAHVPQVGDLVRSSFGLSADTPALAGAVIVRAFHLDPGEEVFSFYALTPGAFHVSQIDTKAAQLRVAVPMSRVRRVSELLDNDGVLVTIEVDADIVRGALSFEARSGPVADGDFDRGELGRGELTLTPAVYDLRAAAGSDEADRVQAFANALRYALIVS